MILDYIDNIFKHFIMELPKKVDILSTIHSKSFNQFLKIKYLVGLCGTTAIPMLTASIIVMTRSLLCVFSYP
jgi:hypothetical protein